MYSPQPAGLGLGESRQQHQQSIQDVSVLDRDEEELYAVPESWGFDYAFAAEELVINDSHPEEIHKKGSKQKSHRRKTKSSRHGAGLYEDDDLSDSYDENEVGFSTDSDDEYHEPVASSIWPFRWPPRSQRQLRQIRQEHTLRMRYGANRRVRARRWRHPFHDGDGQGNDNEDAFSHEARLIAALLNKLAQAEKSFVQLASQEGLLLHDLEPEFWFANAAGAASLETRDKSPDGSLSIARVPGEGLNMNAPEPAVSASGQSAEGLNASERERIKKLVLQERDNLVQLSKRLHKRLMLVSKDDHITIEGTAEGGTSSSPGPTITSSGEHVQSVVSTSLPPSATTLPVKSSSQIESQPADQIQQAKPAPADVDDYPMGISRVSDAVLTRFNDAQRTGDLDLYNIPQMLARRVVLFSPQVLHTAKIWWLTSGMQPIGKQPQQAPPSNGRSYQSSSNKRHDKSTSEMTPKPSLVFTKEMYFHLMLLVHKYLLPHANFGTALLTVEHDWIRDSGGLRLAELAYTLHQALHAHCVTLVTDTASEQESTAAENSNSSSTTPATESASSIASLSSARSSTTTPRADEPSTSSIESKPENSTSAESNKKAILVPVALPKHIAKVAETALAALFDRNPSTKHAALSEAVRSKALPLLSISSIVEAHEKEKQALARPQSPFATATRTLSEAKAAASTAMVANEASKSSLALKVKDIAALPIQQRTLATALLHVSEVLNEISRALSPQTHSPNQQLDGSNTEPVVGDSPSEELSLASSLTFGRFLKGLYDLADVWTRGTSSSEYLNFLSDVYLNISEPNIIPQTGSHLYSSRQQPTFALRGGGRGILSKAQPRRWKPLSDVEMLALKAHLALPAQEATVLSLAHQYGTLSAEEYLDYEHRVLPPKLWSDGDPNQDAQASLSRSGLLFEDRRQQLERLAQERAQRRAEEIARQKEHEAQLAARLKARLEKSKSRYARDVLAADVEAKRRALQTRESARAAILKLKQDLKASRESATHWLQSHQASTQATDENWEYDDAELDAMIAEDDDEGNIDTDPEVARAKAEAERAEQLAREAAEALEKLPEVPEEVEIVPVKETYLQSQQRQLNEWLARAEERRRKEEEMQQAAVAQADNEDDCSDEESSEDETITEMLKALKPGDYEEEARILQLKEERSQARKAYRRQQRRAEREAERKQKAREAERAQAELDSKRALEDRERRIEDLLERNALDELNELVAKETEDVFGLAQCIVRAKAKIAQKRRLEEKKRLEEAAEEAARKAREASLAAAQALAQSAERRKASKLEKLLKRKRTSAHTPSDEARRSSDIDHERKEHSGDSSRVRPSEPGPYSRRTGTKQQRSKGQHVASSHESESPRSLSERLSQPKPEKVSHKVVTPRYPRSNAGYVIATPTPTSSASDHYGAASSPLRTARHSESRSEKLRRAEVDQLLDLLDENDLSIEITTDQGHSAVAGSEDLSAHKPLATSPVPLYLGRPRGSVFSITDVLSPKSQLSPIALTDTARTALSERSSKSTRKRFSMSLNSLTDPKANSEWRAQVEEALRPLEVKHRDAMAKIDQYIEEARSADDEVPLQRDDLRGLTGLATTRQTQTSSESMSPEDRELNDRYTRLMQRLAEIDRLEQMRQESDRQAKERDQRLDEELISLIRSPGSIEPSSELVVRELSRGRGETLLAAMASPMLSTLSNFGDAQSCARAEPSPVTPESVASVLHKMLKTDTTPGSFEELEAEVRDRNRSLRRRASTLMRRASMVISQESMPEHVRESYANNLLSPAISSLWISESAADAAARSIYLKKEFGESDSEDEREAVAAETERPEDLEDVEQLVESFSAPSETGVKGRATRGVTSVPGESHRPASRTQTPPDHSSAQDLVSLLLATISKNPSLRSAMERTLERELSVNDAVQSLRPPDMPDEDWYNTLLLIRERLSHLPSSRSPSVALDSSALLPSKYDFGFRPHEGIDESDEGEDTGDEARDPRETLPSHELTKTAGESAEKGESYYEIEVLSRRPRNNHTRQLSLRQLIRQFHRQRRQSSLPQLESDSSDQFLSVLNEWFESQPASFAPAVKSEGISLALVASETAVGFTKAEHPSSTPETFAFDADHPVLLEGGGPEVSTALLEDGDVSIVITNEAPHENRTLPRLTASCDPQPNDEPSVAIPSLIESPTPALERQTNSPVPTTSESSKDKEAAMDETTQGPTFPALIGSPPSATLYQTDSLPESSQLSSLSWLSSTMGCFPGRFARRRGLAPQRIAGLPPELLRPLSATRAGIFVVRERDSKLPKPGRVGLVPSYGSGLRTYGPQSGLALPAYLFPQSPGSTTDHSGDPSNSGGLVILDPSARHLEAALEITWQRRFDSSRFPPTASERDELVRQSPSALQRRIRRVRQETRKRLDSYFPTGTFQSSTECVGTLLNQSRREVEAFARGQSNGPRHGIFLELRLAIEAISVAKEIARERQRRKASKEQALVRNDGVRSLRSLTIDPDLDDSSYATTEHTQRNDQERRTLEALEIILTQTTEDIRASQVHPDESLSSTTPLEPDQAMQINTSEDESVSSLRMTTATNAVANSPAVAQVTDFQGSKCGEDAEQEEAEDFKAKDISACASADSLSDAHSVDTEGTDASDFHTSVTSDTCSDDDTAEDADDGSQDKPPLTQLSAPSSSDTRPQLLDVDDTYGVRAALESSFSYERMLVNRHRQAAEAAAQRRVVSAFPPVERPGRLPTQVCVTTPRDDMRIDSSPSVPLPLAPTASLVMKTDLSPPPDYTLPPIFSSRSTSPAATTPTQLSRLTSTRSRADLSSSVLVPEALARQATRRPQPKGNATYVDSQGPLKPIQGKTLPLRPAIVGAPTYSRHDNPAKRSYFGMTAKPLSFASTTPSPRSDTVYR